MLGSRGGEHKYRNQRKKCRREKLLSNVKLREVIMRLFLKEQWSPEQIANRFVQQTAYNTVSYATIYWVIYTGMFDTAEQRRSKGSRGTIRKLRHRGKTRHHKATIEARGKIVISNRIQERPQEADDRLAIGYWEADTVAGKTGSACLVTITDRCSGYLLTGKVSKKTAMLVTNEMIALPSGLTKKNARPSHLTAAKNFSSTAV
ncbi:hypothetical protein DSECCO2_226980 [anaerobic digester metagenome]